MLVQLAELIAVSRFRSRSGIAYVHHPALIQSITAAEINI
jgi:hypothetical protein